MVKHSLFCAIGVFLSPKFHLSLFTNIQLFLKPTIKSKSLAKQSWFIKGKVIEEKRFYCKIEIQENKSKLRAYKNVRFEKYTSMRFSIATDEFSVNSLVTCLQVIIYYVLELNFKSHLSIRSIFIKKSFKRE